MANEKEFKVIISVEDGQAKVKIEGLTDALNKNSAASKGAASSTDEFSKSQKELKEPLEGTIGSLERLIKEQQDYIRNQARTPAEVAKAQKAITGHRLEIDKLTKTLGVNSKVNEGMISNAGLAGATLTEVGRTVSDANYGIQGMANNLSQLSNLFVTLMSKTNGFKNAMNLLLGQLTGPLGFILTFQVLITLFEAFSKNQDKAKKESKNLEDQLVSTTSAIRDQNKALQENEQQTRKTERTVSATLLVAKEFMSEVRSGLDDFTDEGLVKANNAFLAISSLLEEAGLKNAEILNDQNLGIEQRIEIANALIQQGIKANEIADYEKQIFADRIKLQELRLDLTKETDEVERMSLENQIKSREDAVAGSVIGLTRLQGEYAQLGELIDIVKKGVDVTPEEAETKREFEKLAELSADSFESSFKEQSKGWKLIEQVFGKDAVKEAKNALQDSAAAALKELSDGVKKKQKEQDEVEDPNTEERIQAVKDSINQVENALNAQFDADISREEAKTEKMNNELRKRLENENLTAKQREAINNQIAANELALQKKRDEIAEKNFKAQKAISVANAMMSTYEAADKALTNLPTPFSFVAAAATIAAGLANVKAIISQQFVPSALPTPNLSVGSVQAPTQIQPPQFNIVGASTRDQLAEAINEKLDKPMKAYVVSKDISTAQELDRNKVLSSGL